MIYISFVVKKNVHYDPLVKFDRKEFITSRTIW